MRFFAFLLRYVKTSQQTTRYYKYRERNVWSKTRLIFFKSLGWETLEWSIYHKREEAHYDAHTQHILPAPWRNPQCRPHTLVFSNKRNAHLQICHERWSMSSHFAIFQQRHREKRELKLVKRNVWLHTIKQATPHNGLLPQCRGVLPTRTGIRHWLACLPASTLLNFPSPHRQIAERQKETVDYRNHTRVWEVC